jgi:hypothetical protein
MKILSLGAALAALFLCLPATATAQRFYSDDPLLSEPPPVAVENPGYRSLNSLGVYLADRFAKLGERQPPDGVIPARGINTLGEVPDGPWFVNRHGRRRLSAEELARGSGDEDPPNPGGFWRVIAFTKDEVLRSVLWILDEDNSLYLLRFDPPGHPEMSTGAAMIGSRLFHALGYWVPEQTLVHFDRSRLEVAPPEEKINLVRDSYRLEEKDIDLFLETVPRDPRNGYRALAIKIPDDAERLGPFQFHGTRGDDPNDITPHEHRRDLRGLHILSSWVGNNWIAAVQTQDVLLKGNDIPFIRHTIEDFLTLLGSGFHRPKGAREGFESLFRLKQALKNLIGFGIYSPAWQRVNYPEIDAVGPFESTLFDPADWQPNYQAAALANHLPDDDYWAAKLLMAFTDEDIRTIVQTAQYSDARASEWISRCLIERRDKIAHYCFERVLPLDNFRLEGDRLEFEDLAVRYGFRQAREYTIRWSEFDNITGEHRSIESQGEREVPQQAQTAETGDYYSAEISAGEAGKGVTVYIRKETGRFKLVGLERSWPDKGPVVEHGH